MNVQKLTLITTIILVLVLIGFIVYPRFQTQPALGTADLSTSPTMGNPAAPVHVVMFENYLCNHCRDFEQEAFPQLYRTFIEPGHVRATRVNIPWGDERSRSAAMASECAYVQNPEAFWSYKTYLYRSINTPTAATFTPAGLADVARLYVPDLDAVDLQQCITEERHADRLQANLALAQSMNITGTPTFLIEDTRIEGNNYNGVRTAIEQRLN